MKSLRDQSVQSDQKENSGDEDAEKAVQDGRKSRSRDEPIASGPFDIDRINTRESFRRPTS